MKRHQLGGMEGKGGKERGGGGGGRERAGKRRGERREGKVAKRELIQVRAWFLEAQFAYRVLSRNFLASLFLNTDPPPKRLRGKVENQTNGHGFSSCSLLDHKSRWRISPRLA